MEIAKLNSSRISTAAFLGTLLVALVAVVPLLAQRGGPPTPVLQVVDSTGKAVGVYGGDLVPLGGYWTKALRSINGIVVAIPVQAFTSIESASEPFGVVFYETPNCSGQKYMQAY